MKSKFHEIAQQQGWTLKQIGERWGVSERQMSRIAKSPKQKDFDAVIGLPCLMADGTTPSGNRFLVKPETQHKLIECAESENISPNDYMDHLLEDDLERQRILKLSNDNKIEIDGAPIQVISKTVNECLSVLDKDSNIVEYQIAIESLYERLLKEKLINTKVLVNQVAESQRLKIPRIAYYWYGGILAKHAAMWFGTYDVYLWHEILRAESEVVFIGMPNNVVVSYLVCMRLCQLLKRVKTNNKKSMGAGSKRDIEDASNDFIYHFAQGITDVRAGFIDEDDWGHLFNYADKNYAYAMRD